MKKIYLLLVFLLGTAGLTYSQTAGDDASKENWTLLKETPDVRIYSKLTECYGQNVALLKFENISTADVNVTWNRPTTVLVSSTGPEIPNQFSVDVVSNQIIQGACSLNTSPGLNMILVTPGMPELEFQVTVKSN